MKSSVGRWIGILIGMNAEVVVLIFASYYGGAYLDDVSPIRISWVTIFMLVSVLVFVSSLWRVAAEIWRESQRDDGAKS